MMLMPKRLTRQRTAVEADRLANRDQSLTGTVQAKHVPVTVSVLFPLTSSLSGRFLHDDRDMDPGPPPRVRVWGLMFQHFVLLTWLCCRQEMHKEGKSSEERAKNPLGGRKTIRMPGNMVELNIFRFTSTCLLN